MSNKKSIEILERLKHVTQVKTDSGLSEVLGVSPQTLSSWKGRDSIPYSICIDIARDQGIYLDWLFGGHGSMRLSTCSCLCEAVDRLNTQEQKMLQVFRELDETDQKIIYKWVEEKNRLQVMNNRIETLATRLETIIKRL